jgi:hypothetical protein
MAPVIVISSNGSSWEISSGCFELEGTIMFDEFQVGTTFAHINNGESEILVIKEFVVGNRTSWDLQSTRNGFTSIRSCDENTTSISVDFIVGSSQCPSI